MGIDELKATLENLSIPLADRIKALITKVPQIEGATFSDRVWLGQILLHTVTEEQEADLELKGKIDRLKTLVQEWQGKVLAHS